MRRMRDLGMGGRMGGVLMAVSLGTLAMTALVDFVVWPLILGRTGAVSVNVVAVVFGFGSAVAFSVVASVFIARRLGRTMAKLEGAARQVADGRSGVRVAPVALGPEADGLVSAFNEMAVQLESTDESRRRLLADLAHEIRTPVSVLEAYIEAIEDGVRTLTPATAAMLRDADGPLPAGTVVVNSISLGRVPSARYVSSRGTPLTVTRPASSQHATVAEFIRLESDWEASWLHTVRAAWMADNKQPNSTEASMSKAKAGRTVTDITNKTVEIGSTAGYSETSLVEKWARDSKILDIFEGTQQIQQLIIARRVLGKSSTDLT